MYSVFRRVMFASLRHRIMIANHGISSVLHINKCFLNGARCQCSMHISICFFPRQEQSVPPFFFVCVGRIVPLCCLPDQTWPYPLSDLMCDVSTFVKHFSTSFCLFKSLSLLRDKFLPSSRIRSQLFPRYLFTTPPNRFFYLFLWANFVGKLTPVVVSFSLFFNETPHKGYRGYLDKNGLKRSQDIFDAKLYLINWRIFRELEKRKLINKW